jgi:hypothetical protein
MLSQSCIENVLGFTLLKCSPQMQSPNAVPKCSPQMQSPNAVIREAP